MRMVSEVGSLSDGEDESDDDENIKDEGNERSSANMEQVQVPLIVCMRSESPKEASR